MAAEFDSSLHFLMCCILYIVYRYSGPDLETKCWELPFNPLTSNP